MDQVRCYYNILVSRFADTQWILLNPKMDASRKQLIFSKIYKPEAERMKDMMKDGTVEVSEYPKKLGELSYNQSYAIKKILSKKFKEREKRLKIQDEIIKEQARSELSRKK